MSELRASTELEPTLGDRLRKSRTVAGLSRADMALRVGVSRSALNGYELDSHRPKIETLEKWAETCEVPFDWLCIGRSSTKWYSRSVGTAA
jgi:transcriptional regulator with XRE-family HTH domain